MSGATTVQQSSALVTESPLPAILDESRAPLEAVVTRFGDSGMLRGKIQQVGQQWVWHFVLDSLAGSGAANGSAHSYEAARDELTSSLARAQVQLKRRTLSPALPPRTRDGRARGELPPLR